MTRAEPLSRPVEAIVIGASAGGVEALTLVLPALPEDLQASVLVVLHLPRGRPSLLVEIFREKCALAVREAEDKEPIEPGTIYFAPPDYHLQVDVGPRLSLSTDAPVNHSRPSIDVLFTSAADLYGPELMGVILTGANQDGAVGLEAVHEAGGYTVVQQPESSYASSMTQAAIDLVDVDRVLTLEQIAELFRSLGTVRGRDEGRGGHGA